MNNQEKVRCHQLSFENPDTAVTVISSIFGGFPHYMDVLSSIFQALFDDALWSGVVPKDQGQIFNINIKREKYGMAPKSTGSVYPLLHDCLPYFSLS